MLTGEDSAPDLIRGLDQFARNKVPAQGRDSASGEAFLSESAWQIICTLQVILIEGEVAGADEIRTSPRGMVSRRGIEPLFTP